MGMEDLLKAILGGSAGTQDEQAAGDPVADLLGSILGGAAAPQEQSEQAGIGGGLADLLGGILGGGAQGGGDIGDILGGILGGGGQGAAPQGGGGLGGILGGILGGGQADLGGHSFLGPIVDGLARKLGLSPAIAQAVVAFAVSKLVPMLLGRVAAPAQAQAPVQPQRTEQAEGFDLDDLLERMGSGSRRKLSTNYLRSTGLAAELADQTELDTKTAAKSLQEVLLALGSTLSGPQPSQPSKESGLDDMLDSWKVK